MRNLLLRNSYGNFWRANPYRPHPNAELKYDVVDLITCGMGRVREHNEASNKEELHLKVWEGHQAASPKD